MGYKRVFFVNAVLIFTLAISSCATPAPAVPTPLPTPLPTVKPTTAVFPSATPIPTVRTSHQLYAGLTGDHDVPFLAFHPSGEILGVNKSIYSGGVTVMYRSKTGETAVVYADSGGLPRYAVAGNEIFEYANYTKSTVDVTVIHADGSREMIRTKISGMLPDGKLSNALDSYKQVTLPIGSRAVFQQQVFGYLEEGLFALDIATCALAGAAFTLTGPGAIALVGACAGPLLHEYILEQKAQNLDVGPLESIEKGLDIAGCTLMLELMDCVKFIVGELAEAEEQANEQVSNIPPAPKSVPTKSKYP